MALNGMDSRSDCSSHCFSFEQDFIGNWRCIPLCVRRKLDLVGIKLKLNHWLALEQPQRQQLVDWSDAPSEWAGLRQHLRDLTVGMADGVVKDLPPAVDAPWQCMDQVPLAIAEAADQRGVALSVDGWARLSELDRFALCKLARPGHDHHNLDAAFTELLG